MGIPFLNRGGTRTARTPTPRRLVIAADPRCQGDGETRRTLGTTAYLSGVGLSSASRVNVGPRRRVWGVSGFARGRPGLLWSTIRIGLRVGDKMFDGVIPLGGSVAAAQSF